MMRLRDLIVALDDESLGELAHRVIPGAGEQRPELWPHILETLLQATGHVEQVIFARRPPVAAILLALLEAEGFWLPAEQLREKAEDQTHSWCKKVSAGELANRMPEHSRIYRRMLAAAWGNDLSLDASEVRMLGLLRDELGLLRMDHFLMAHDSVIQVYWRGSDYFDIAVAALVRGAVLFRHQGGLVIPQELVEHVRRATGLDLSRDAANRLYSKLDSGSHLKSALADFDLPTSGSKQDRVDRLIEHFAPPHSVVDAMHISQVRDLARDCGVSASGPKHEVVARIIAQVQTGKDRAAAVELPVLEREERALTKAQFERLFLTLKGHELQQLLLGLEQPHSGTKEARVATLWRSPFSETSILNRLKADELSDLLARSAVGARGNKKEKIDALLDHHRSADDSEVAVGSANPNVAPPKESFLQDVGRALHRIELSSKGPTRFDAVKQLVADRFGILPEAVGVKYLPEQKNYRNRVGEALRGTPQLLLLLTRPGEGESVLDAAADRLAASSSTHCLALSCPIERDGEGGGWACEGILCAEETSLLVQLRKHVPDAEVRLASVSESVAIQVQAVLDQAQALQEELWRDWNEADVEAESRVRCLLEARFAEVGAAVRTKHVSDKKNLGNRISEGMGAGCSALLLTVPEELVEEAQAELFRQMTMSQRPALAVVLAESEAGGYARPILTTRPLR